VFVLVTLLTIVYLQRSPRIYAATATLQVEQQEQKILKFDRVIQEDLRSTETLRTILQTLKTRSLLERVAASTKLGENPHFIGPDGSQLTTNQVAGMLERLITIRLRSGTRLIDVIVEHTDPEVTAIVANALIRDFIRLGFDQDSAASDLATEHLQREAERLKPKLHESEMALQNYMSDSKSVSLEDRQNIVVPKLKELSTKVNEGKYALIKQEADYQNFKALGTNAMALLALSAVANDPTVFGLQVNIAKLESEFATLKQRYRAEHPKYLQMETQLGELRNALTDAVLRVQQFMETAYASAQASQEALENALAEQEKAALELNKQAI
jgi:uncharacterized protein involved in exopolysaccharide biosynthesis